ncbi:MAG: amidohydrolase [Acetobacteraceae bacterium]|nr:amidohydrolase [Acetobacteraceae bacterium]
MPVINRIAEFHDQMTAWRHDFHMHPELAFEEHRTAGIVADRLREFGVDEVHTGIGRTGVVGVIRGRPGAGTIGLRADMDALPIHEDTGVAHASTTPGKMHACGHDGHTTMLLGAAKYLAETRNFDGTVHLIFQPAEENFGGAKVMIDEGLFERFPCDEVYGIHNMPNTPSGIFAWKVGPMMAAVGNFIITVKGRGAHGAFPHHGLDPIPAAAAIVMALQSIVARNLDPLESGVVSVCGMKGGETFNVTPPSAELRGTTRWFSPKVGDLLEERLTMVAKSVAQGMGCTADVWYQRMYPPTVNHADQTAKAEKIAAEIAGEARVRELPAPVMGGEDFSFMLEKRPGSFLYLGGGRTDSDPNVHHPKYDFNDEILPIGASYLARVAERLLGG